MNPYLLSHSQACHPLHHARHEVPALSEADRRSAKSKCAWLESHQRSALIERVSWLLDDRRLEPPFADSGFGGQAAGGFRPRDLHVGNVASCWLDHGRELPGCLAPIQTAIA